MEIIISKLINIIDEILISDTETPHQLQIIRAELVELLDKERDKKHEETV